MEQVVPSEVPLQKHLRERRAKVFLAGRNLASVAATAKDIAAAGGAAEAAQVDALDEGAVESHMADTRRSSLSFTELLKAIAGIATNVLSDRLRVLVSQEILAVTPSESDGRKLVYSLSSKGSALEPVLAELEAWASNYCSRLERDR